MRMQRFEWRGADATALGVRDWAFGEVFEEHGHREIFDGVRKIAERVFKERDAALLDLTRQYDGVALAPEKLRVDPGDAEDALRGLDSAQREAMELAAVNIRSVAEAQIPALTPAVELPQGQTVSIREVAVSAAGI